MACYSSRDFSFVVRVFLYPAPALALGAAAKCKSAAAKKGSCRCKRANAKAAAGARAKGLRFTGTPQEFGLKTIYGVWGQKKVRAWKAKVLGSITARCVGSSKSASMESESVTARSVGADTFASMESGGGVKSSATLLTRRHKYSLFLLVSRNYCHRHRRHRWLHLVRTMMMTSFMLMMMC